MTTYTTVSWMTVDDHGATTGNGYVTHTCEGGYKGRVQRRGYTTITTSEATPKSVNVEFIQSAKSEYVAFDQKSYAVTKTGGTVTITGKTNAPRLGFVLTDDTDDICTLPTYFSILPEGASSPTTNQAVSGQEFTNDPGATKEIAFTIEVTIAANADTKQRACRIVAVGSDGIYDDTYVNQEEGESYVYVDAMNTTSKTVTFNAAGTSGGLGFSVDVEVLSNDHWDVEHDETVTWASVYNSKHYLDGTLTFSVERNYKGRVQREKIYDLVTDGDAEASVTIVQTGTNYLNGSNSATIGYSVTGFPLQFTSNLQKFSLALGGTDSSHFTISKVYYKTVDGVEHDIADWSGTIEPQGDPGASSRYYIYVILNMEQNNTADDKVATLTVTGWNTGSETTYTKVATITHEHNPALDEQEES